MSNIYEFSVKNTKGEDISLDHYRGKVLLVVNTASGCGFTPQYEGLEALYRKYRDQGLEILDFPCNQFLNQAPGTDEELAAFCQVNYGTSFETFAKLAVNGDHAHPLYAYLKNAVPLETEDESLLNFKERLKKHLIEWMGNDIKWNFTKFLVDREGHVVKRFAPTVVPKDLEKAIEAQL